MTYDRNPGFDIARAIAVILIIITHSTSILGFDNSGNFLNRSIYSYTTYYGLGLFTMLSGALQMRGKYSVLDFYKKRFIRILIPFAFWATVVYAISSVMGKYDNIHSVRDAFVNYIPALLFHRINVAYWYIYLILLLYVLTPVFIKLFSHRQKFLVAILVLWVVIETLFRIKKPFSTVLFYAGLYLLGYFVNGFVKRSSVSSLWGTGGFILLFVISSFPLPDIISFPLRLVSLICLFVGLTSVTHFNPSIQNFSRYSFTVYLTHFIFIRSLYTLFPQFFAFNCFMPLLMTAIVAIMEYFFCMLLERCKFVPNKVVGI